MRFDKIEPDTDWLSVGRKLDRLIETHFPERRIAIRGIGLVDHPGWSLDDLVSTIVRLGTDKYDPHREDLYYARDEVSDIHAGPGVVMKEGLQAQKHLDGSVMAKVVRLFYNGALADRGYSIRLDVVMIYDLDQLEPCAMRRSKSATSSRSSTRIRETRRCWESSSS